MFGLSKTAITQSKDFNLSGSASKQKPAEKKVGI